MFYLGKSLLGLEPRDEEPINFGAVPKCQLVLIAFSTLSHLIPATADMRYLPLSTSYWRSKMPRVLA